MQKDVIPILIKNGKLHTMMDAPYIGNIRVEKSQIKEIARDLKAFDDEEIIDARGLYVLPGFIDPHTHLGIGEEGIGFEGNDVNEYSSPITPHLKGIDAFNPADTAIKESIEAGVTSVAVGPGSANVIGGLFSMIKLGYKQADQSIIKENVGMKCALGENPKRVGKEKKHNAYDPHGNSCKVKRSLILS